MFQILTTQPQGLPQVHIPNQFLWDIVEFFSYQRLDVTYSYQATSFLVTFNRLDAAGANQALHEWEHARAQLVA